MGAAIGRGRAATRRSDNRQALPTLETTSFDDFTAACGGHARAVADLAGALLTVRTECWLHDFLKKRGSVVPNGIRRVKGDLGEVLRVVGLFTDGP